VKRLDGPAATTEFVNGCIQWQDVFPPSLLA